MKAFLIRKLMEKNKNRLLCYLTWSELYGFILDSK